MDTLTLAPLTLALMRAQVTASGGNTTLGSTGTIHFAIRGKAYTHAAFSSTATPTTDWATGAAFLPVLANYGSAYMVGLNAAGSVKVVQGTIVPLDSSGNLINAPQFGALPLDFCPVAYITALAGSTATGAGWIFGTSNWNATGLTVTVQDVIGLPDRPQIS